MEKALLLYNDIKNNVLSDVEDIFFAADVKQYLHRGILLVLFGRGGGGLNLEETNWDFLFSILMKSKENYFDLRLF